MLNEYSLYDESIRSFASKEREMKYARAELLYRMTASLNRKSGKDVLTNVLEGTGHFLVATGNRLLNIA